MRPLEGARSYDEGNECSQPLLYNSIRDFQVHPIAGRSRVLAQESNRMNNYTAMISINDDQGGDHYGLAFGRRSSERPGAPRVRTACASAF